MDIGYRGYSGSTPIRLCNFFLRSYEIHGLFITPSVSGGCNSFDIVCVCVCLGVLRALYTPLQRYMGYLCTRKAQYAPLRRKTHMDKFNDFRICKLPISKSFAGGLTSTSSCIFWLISGSSIAGILKIVRRPPLSDDKCHVP